MDELVNLSFYCIIVFFIIISQCKYRNSGTKIKIFFSICIDAIEHGVSRVHILDGRIPHCLLLEIFTNKGVGTAILSKEAEKFFDTNI